MPPSEDGLFARVAKRDRRLFTVLQQLDGRLPNACYRFNPQSNVVKYHVSIFVE